MNEEYHDANWLFGVCKEVFNRLASEYGLNKVLSATVGTFALGLFVYSLVLANLTPVQQLESIPTITNIEKENNNEN